MSFYLLSHNQLDFDRVSDMEYEVAYESLSNISFEGALWNTYLIILGQDTVISSFMFGD